MTLAHGEELVYGGGVKNGRPVFVVVRHPTTGRLYWRPLPTEDRDEIRTMPEKTVDELLGRN